MCVCVSSALNTATAVVVVSSEGSVCVSSALNMATAVVMSSAGRVFFTAFL